MHGEMVNAEEIRGGLIILRDHFNTTGTRRLSLVELEHYRHGVRRLYGFATLSRRFKAPRLYGSQRRFI